MFRQWFVNAANHLASGRIQDDLLVAVVLSVDFSCEVIPLARLAVQVIAGDGLVDWLLVTRTLVFQPDLLAERQRFLNVDVERACRRTTCRTWRPRYNWSVLRFFDACAAL